MTRASFNNLFSRWIHPIHGNTFVEWVGETYGKLAGDRLRACHNMTPYHSTPPLGTQQKHWARTSGLHERNAGWCGPEY